MSSSACANVRNAYSKKISKKNEILTCRPPLLLVNGVHVCEIGIGIEIGDARKYTFLYNCSTVLFASYGGGNMRKCFDARSAGTYLLMFYTVTQNISQKYCARH